MAAAISCAADAGLPSRWPLGWSFGTELALGGALMLRPAGTSRAPPYCRRRCAGPTDADLDRWAGSGKTLIALIPGLDRYLRPDEGRRRFARVPSAEVIAVEGAKHL